MEDEDADYLCENNKWKNLNAADDDDDEKSSSSTKKSSSSKKDDSGDSAKSSSSAKQSSSSAKSSSSVKQSSSAASELLTCGDAGTYDPSVRFCYKESLVVNRCSGKTYEPGEEICKDGKPVTLTKGTFLDSRNGVTYKTVTIGKQTWMAENLNYDDSVSTPNLKGGNWCYDNKEENCETYGRLYTWAAAMNLESKYNGSHAKDLVQTKHQGICPEGWHIPTYEEWYTLEDYVDWLDDDGDNVGYWLKTQYGWDNLGNGIDGVGFSAQPTGLMFEGDFYDLGSLTYLWSSSEQSNLYAYCSDLESDNYYLDIYDSGKNNGQSVRCLKN